MSIDAAIGRIDQIYTLQQQLLDPATLAAGGSAPSTDGGSAVSGSASSTPSTDFASALATAQGLTGGTSALGPTAAAGGTGLPSAGGLSASPTGLTAPTGLTTAGTALGSAGATGGVGLTGGSLPPQVQAMVNQANTLLGKPYVWGGGHSGWGPQSGYDCSGFVSAVLHAGGYLSAPQDTQTLPSQPGIEAGPGQYVTIYDRTDAGGSDHVIIDLGGQFYESGGEHGSWGGGGGVEKIATPSQSYLSTFNLILHPAGL